MDGSNPGIILTLLSFIGGFSVLVFIHEWGHYSVARLFGVRVDSFSIGFGKELFGWTDKKGVRWKVCMLPLGGYVKFFGDASGASNADSSIEQLSEKEKSECFHYKPVWQRALVVFAGPGINLLAAVLVFAGFFWAYGAQVTPPIVPSVLEDSGAERSGMQVGDRIVSINGNSIERFNDIVSIVRLYPEREIDLVLERDGQSINKTLLTGVGYQEDRFGNRYPYGVMGIGIPQSVRVEVGPVGAISEGFRQTGTFIQTIFTTTGQIIVGLRSVNELGGPVRIATMTGEAASRGIESFIIFLALISINLGIVNLLPIPVLDGGHLMFYLVEAVKGSPLKKRAQEVGYIAGMALMLIFMVFVTLNDLQSIVL
ncbi:RIP metalloprotease RseP [Kordiimonas sp. SCSIO 12610]|uniref:RIP metalloprotease RseP n=1 Tax=Kordiimonas sp. SCSIO 12610 TaxID=2829597 RepID=UPI00210C88D6|nr:RIP metalloprotease RseP [Kordiimonas sp. SCSIO 12610]UTW54049.1 RIP metalloprotease RseP [Kordiimonas sp. SCSIO 12610]